MKNAEWPEFNENDDSGETDASRGVMSLAVLKRC